MEYTKMLIVFKIDVGNLPKVKAAEYCKGVLETFKNSITLPDHIKCIGLAVKGDSFKGHSIEVISLSPDVDTSEIEKLLGDEKEQLINVRISKVEKSVMLQQSKKLGFKTLSEYLRFVGLNTETKNVIENPFNDIEITKSYLFIIKTDGVPNHALTALMCEISIEEDKIKLTFLLDDKNTWYDLLKSSKNFEVSWLNKKGDIINSFPIKNTNKKVFPLKFSHNDNNGNIAHAMAIFKYEFGEMP